MSTNKVNNNNINNTSNNKSNNNNKFMDAKQDEVNGNHHQQQSQQSQQQPQQPQQSQQTQQQTQQQSQQQQSQQQGPPSTIKSYQEGQKQQLQSANYTSACQWAAQQSPHMVPQIAASPPPPKEPIRPKGDRIGADEIQVVQNHIEKCLQLYMNQNEVITALVSQANIEPGFTSLVWQRLEEQNPDFFRGYHVRLRVKEQITAFNYLATQQYQALQKANPSYFTIPSTTTVPGNFSFRADGQPTPPSTSPPTTSAPSSAPSLSTSSSSQNPRSPPPTQTSSQSHLSVQKSQPLPTTKQPQKPGQKKDDFLDTNIFFEQPS